MGGYAVTYRTQYSQFRKGLRRRNPKLLSILDSFESDLVQFLEQQRDGHHEAANLLAIRWRLKRLVGSVREFEASPFDQTVDVRVIWTVHHDELVLEFVRVASHTRACDP